MSCFGGGDDNTKEQSRKNKAINDQLKRDKDVYKSTHRLLLLGKLWVRFDNYWIKEGSVVSEWHPVTLVRNSL